MSPDRGVPLSPRSTSGAALLEALTYAHQGGFHSLRLVQHGVGGIFELHRSLSKQLRASGETWLVIHKMMMFG